MRKDQESYGAFCERLIRYALIERLIKIPPSSPDMNDDFAIMIWRAATIQEKQEKAALLLLKLKQEEEIKRQQKAVDMMTKIQSGQMPSAKEMDAAINEKMAGIQPIYKDRDEMYRSAKSKAIVHFSAQSFDYLAVLPIRPPTVEWPPPA